MASAFDDLLSNLVDKLKSAGVGSKRTAAQNRAEIDYMTASNRAAQAGQASMRDYPYYYGRGDAPATSYSADLPSRKFYDSFGTRISGYDSETGGGYSKGGLFGGRNKSRAEIAETMRGAVPDAISEYEMRQLQIEQNIRDEEDANAPKDQGFGQSTLERKLYDAKIEEDRRRREDLVKDNIPIERRANEERRMLSQAQSEKERRGLFDYGGMDMRSQQQTIDIDPIVLEIPDKPTNEEVIRTLEQDYADLAAAGADTATLSQLAKEIDSYRSRQSSLPSIVSEAAASDVIENAPVNYDAFGNVVSQPETEVLMSRQAQVLDPVEVQTETLLKSQLGRLGFDTPQARERLNDLAEKIAMIESSGNPEAKNIPVKGKKASSATGLYQFLVDTSKGQSALQTAVNRTKKYVKADWLDEVARTGKVEKLSPEQQTILFLGDIMEKKGSDQYLKKLLDPNASQEEINKAMLDIYSKLHHTDVDERTLNRAKKFIK